MIKLNKSLVYRKFINERDDALERILDSSRLRLTEITDQNLVRVIEIIKSRYDFANSGMFSYLSKQRFISIEHEIGREFETFTYRIFSELVSLRKKTYLLAFLGEHKAIDNSTTATVRPKLTKHELDQKAVERRLFGDIDPVRKISFELSKLKQKIINALEMSSLLEEDVNKAIGRVYLTFPKVKPLPKKAALKRVKVTEADSIDINLKKGTTWGFEIDPNIWASLIEDYAKIYIPEDRSPASFFDIKNPYTDEKMTDEVPPEQRYYEWEVTRDVNNDFVNQVRSGQIDAANQNGIDEFVVISIIDDKTCDSCCGGVGCVDFHGRFTSEVEEMTDGEFSSPPYHFNCRCALAPASKDLEFKPDFTDEDFNKWLTT